MKKVNVLNLMILFTLFVALSLGTGTTAFGGDYGGDSSSSSSSDKEENKDGGSSTQITKLSDKEVKKIFDLIGGKEGKDLSNLFSGTDLTQRELMEIRQAILEGNMDQANFNADLISGLTLTVECLDAAGQVSQLGLSFVPGVGWVAAGLLDGARDGADAYRDGKSASEILSAATIGAATSVAINKLSPLNADKTFKGAKRAWSMATKKGGKRTAQASWAFIKNVAKYTAKKETERRAGNTIKGALNNASKKTPNRVSRPSYTTNNMGTGGFDVSSTGQKYWK